MTTSRTEIKNLQAGQYGSIPSAAGDQATVKAAISSMHSREYIYENAADDDGTTDLAERPFAHVRRAGKVNSISVVCDATAITADNSNYVVITVKKYTAGASGTTVGTYDSRAANNGAAASMTPVEFTLVAAAVSLAAGDVLTLTEASTGTKVWPAGCVTVDVEEV